MRRYNFPQKYPGQKSAATLRALGLGLVASLLLAAPLSAQADPALLPVAVGDAFAVKANGNVEIYWDEVLANDTDAYDIDKLSPAQIAEVKHGQVTDHYYDSFNYKPDWP